MAPYEEELYTIAGVAPEIKTRALSVHMENYLERVDTSVSLVNQQVTTTLVDTC